MEYPNNWLDEGSILEKCDIKVEGVEISTSVTGERVVIELEAGEENLPKVKRGRPRGSTEAAAIKDQSPVTLAGKRILLPPSTTPTPRKQPTAGVTPKQKDPSSTATRPNFFLVGKPSGSFGFSKLPKSKEVLTRFLYFTEVEKKSSLEASKNVMEEVKNVLYCLPVIY